LSAPLALRAAKLAISRSDDLALEAGNFISFWPFDWADGFSGLDFERAYYESLLPTRDRLEALEAFREKRKPFFTGE